MNQAAAAGNIDLINKIQTNILNPLISGLFAIALVVFLYGVFEFIRSQESSDARQTGARHILWGVIGMVVMVSAFGIIHVIQGTFGL